MSEISEQNERVNVSLGVMWQGTSGKYDTRLSEISMDGCFIDSMGQEVLGETINFKVRVPSGIWVSLQGEVVAQEYPIGFEVSFAHLTEENRRLLIEVIAAHGGKQAQQLLSEEPSPLAIIPDPNSSSPAANSTSTSVQIPQQLKRVLIADDDAMTLEIVKAIVESQGYAVTAAQDGREAFKILQHDNDFSAAIFDMKMPHLDGLDLIHYMKTDERLRLIPIGMITAEQDPKIWNESVSAGASVFLPKPFSPPQIQMMLRMLVSKSD